MRGDQFNRARGFSLYDLQVHIRKTNRPQGKHRTPR